MKITVIYGTERKSKSTTYQIAQRVIKNLKEEDEVFEFFLPKDMNGFCKGCYMCFEGKSEKCSDYSKITPIRNAMNESDLIIFTVPVYVYHVPGQMKAFLDHFGWEWMVHQLNGRMFTKQALIISTAAGGGIKSTIKDMRHSMDFWGMGRVYTYKKAIWKAHWSELEDNTKEKTLQDIDKISEDIYKRKGKVAPRLKVKLMFYGCRLMHKKVGTNPPDVNHWKKHGWLEKERPWKTL